MSDCEETDFFGKLWMSPGKKKRKRKKDTKKSSKKDQKIKTEDSQKKKKKKNLKFKGVMAKRKAKEKDKKKKKKSKASELGDSLALAQALSAQADLTVKPHTSTAQSNDRQLRPGHLTPDCKTKRKKRVAFDLSPGYIHAKRPRFASSSLQCAKDIIVSENDAVGDSESPSMVPMTRLSEGQTQDDSQCNSEDMNSQDLFITQKTFRASSPEPSSGEASDKVITATPQVLTQQGLLHTAMTRRKQHLEGSGSCPQDSHVFQHLRKADKHAKKPRPILPAEGEGVNKTHHPQKNGNISLQTQIELNASLSEEEKASPPAQRKLAQPVVVSQSHASGQQPTRSTSTQTENFFTTELSSFLNFIDKQRASSQLEHLKPLDLSLPQRNRKVLRPSSSMKISSLSGQIEGDKKAKSSSLSPTCNTDTKDVQVKKETPENKSETTLSPESECEPKSASSEDNEPPCRSGRLDLTQVRAVQMRLNESFFFKTKRDGQSPRPASPLMKLVQGRDVKSRKGH